MFFLLTQEKVDVPLSKGKENSPFRGTEERKKDRLTTVFFKAMKNYASK